MLIQLVDSFMLKRHPLDTMSLKNAVCLSVIQSRIISLHLLGHFDGSKCAHTQHINVVLLKEATVLLDIMFHKTRIIFSTFASSYINWPFKSSLSDFYIFPLLSSNDPFVTRSILPQSRMSMFWISAAEAANSWATRINSWNNAREKLFPAHCRKLFKSRSARTMTLSNLTLYSIIGGVDNNQNQN